MTLEQAKAHLEAVKQDPSVGVKDPVKTKLAISIVASNLGRR